MRGVAVALLVLLGGCLEAPASPDSEGVVHPYVLVCPPGATRETNPSVCVGSLALPDAWLAEPSVAAHPTRPGVLALGANAARILPMDPAVPALPPFVPSPAALTALFVSEDGGGSWRHVALPLLPGWAHSGDPTLAFDADGTLHMAELVLSPETNAVAVLSTPDLGASWRSTVLDNPTSVDRPWLAALDDGLYLTWQTSAPLTQAAWSRDGGATWERLAEPVANCNLQTHVVAAPEGPLFACVRGEDQTYRVQLLHLDTTAKTASVVATLGGSSGTLHLFPAPAAPRLLVQTYGNGTTTGRFHRGDAPDWPTVGPPLRDAGSVDDAWSWLFYGAAGSDAAGANFAVQIGGTGEDCFRGTCDDAAQRRQVGLLVLDGAGRTALGTLLTPGDAAERQRPQGSRLDLKFGDDFAALAPLGEATFVAWGHDGGIDYTLVHPA